MTIFLTTAPAQIIVHPKYAILTFINMMRILHANSHFRPYAILILEIVMAMVVDGMKTIATWTMLPFWVTVSFLLPKEWRPDLSVLLAVVAKMVQSRCTIDKLLEEWWTNPTSRPLKINLKNKKNQNHYFQSCDQIFMSHLSQVISYIMSHNVWISSEINCIPDCSYPWYFLSHFNEFN